MKIYVLADMEGISGINQINQVMKESPEDYAVGRRLLMDEINLVVDKLFSLGVTEVVVRDAHRGGNNIESSQMDPRAKYEPAEVRSLSMLDESFDGIILIGQHSMAGTLNGFLDHTMNSMEWFSFKINGEAVGEIEIIAARAGVCNVPVLAVTGDEAAVREARAFLGNVECAVVKYGVGRNLANCLPLKESHSAITSAIERGIKLIGSLKPYKPALPADVELTFYRSDYADRYNGHSEFKRVNARTIRRVIDSFEENMW